MAPNWLGGRRDSNSGLSFLSESSHAPPLGVLSRPRPPGRLTPRARSAREPPSPGGDSGESPGAHAQPQNKPAKWNIAAKAKAVWAKRGSLKKKSADSGQVSRSADCCQVPRDSLTGARSSSSSIFDRDTETAHLKRCVGKHCQEQEQTKQEAKPPDAAGKEQEPVPEVPPRGRRLLRWADGRNSGSKLDNRHQQPCPLEPRSNCNNDSNKQASCGGSLEPRSNCNNDSNKQSSCGGPPAAHTPYKGYAVAANKVLPSPGKLRDWAGRSPPHGGHWVARSPNRLRGRTPSPRRADAASVTHPDRTVSVPGTEAPPRNNFPRPPASHFHSTQPPQRPPPPTHRPTGLCPSPPPATRPPPRHGLAPRPPTPDYPGYQQRGVSLRSKKTRAAPLPPSVPPPGHHVSRESSPPVGIVQLMHGKMVERMRSTSPPAGRVHLRVEQQEEAAPLQVDRLGNVTPPPGRVQHLIHQAQPTDEMVGAGGAVMTLQQRKKQLFGSEDL